MKFYSVRRGGKEIGCAVIKEPEEGESYLDILDMFGLELKLVDMLETRSNQEHGTEVEDVE